MATHATVAERASAGEATRATGSELALPGRYQDLGLLASGAFGDVRRVRDALFDRVVAMKILRAEHADDLRVRRRFLAEARITAQLQHPGIIAVHDQGELSNGRLWFTMKEVRGKTVRDVITELHAAAGPQGFVTTRSGWSFRRVVDAFARIAQAIAYAHGQGVVHRDLKPSNLMVGELGEVLVMDWGLGRRLVEADADDELDDRYPARAHSPELTRHGEILGTPAYMPPEQASGDRAAHGQWSDVYALGAVLYHLLVGRPPYHGLAPAGMLDHIRASPPVPVLEAARGGPPVPAELALVCERAMHRDIGARTAGAGPLAQEVLAWLDGAERRERALASLAAAHPLWSRMTGLRSQAAQVRGEARSLLGALQPFDAVDRKRPGWELEDLAAELARAATLCETELLQVTHGALTVDPDLPEAHALLADHYRERLVEAELGHRSEEVARCEALLRAHDRGRHAAFLRGDAALTLVTDPPGAEVVLYRYVMRDRRLVPELVRVLGTTPLHAVALSHGSYLLRIRAPDRAEVRYPVLLERDQHWDGCAPGQSRPYPIVLPHVHALGPDDVWVAPGWCWIGGDVDACESLPRRRIWVDAFIMRRHPVTNREYLAFLDDLVARGDENAALAAAPRSHLGLVEGAEVRLAFDRDAAGRFVLPEVVSGPPWQPDWPVVQVDWHGAMAYSRWLAGQTGHGWRLPDELEREKAARGVDGRVFPWGDHGDTTFARVLASDTGEPGRAPVDGFPLDESPYGVRGLAGNTRDWCINVWKHEGPRVEGERLVVDAAAPDDADFRSIRGGSWNSTLPYSRCAARFAGRPGACWLVTGLRLARSARSD